jgi:hypothetical protein
MAPSNAATALPSVELSARCIPWRRDDGGKYCVRLLLWLQPDAGLVPRHKECAENYETGCLPWLMKMPRTKSGFESVSTNPAPSCSSRRREMDARLHRRLAPKDFKDCKLFSN